MLGRYEKSVLKHNLKILTSPMRTFSSGTTTSSKVMPLVSEHLCPMFFSFLPGVTPGVSASTINPVKALLAGHLGSGFVLARTK